jgi:HK97 family phage portal protein
MSLLERIGLKAAPPPRTVERALDTSAFDVATEVRRATAWALSLPPSKVWHTQPYVRTVVTFLARNIAQLGVHTFRRIDDNQRERVRDHPVAKMLRRPNETTTSFELIFGLVCDKALYERAYWLIGRDSSGNDTLTRIPPARVTAHNADDPLGPIESFHVADVTNGGGVDVPASRVLYFPGWNPSTSVGMPSSPLDSIKSVIAEQAAAFEFRKLAWQNGAQIGGAIERPQGVQWKEGARERFISDVRDKFSGDGSRRGGFMLLEDGMKLNTQQFNAREAEWIEAAKLSLSLVAAIYHVNPTMVGLLDNANYSNVREFRKMLYGDTLGPIMASIEDRLNAFLVPRYDDSDELYVEFNIAEKLQGSFEEQAAAMQTSVGAPWMTRAEARARLNMPPVEGADELVVPLNVLIGGQASPRDSAPPASAASSELDSAKTARELGRREPQQRSNVISIKARVDEQQQRKIAEVLSSFFGKQSRSVLSRLGANEADWWDGERWDRELTDALHALAVQLAATIGRREAERLGFDASSYDEARTVEFLRNTAERFATNINATTKSQLDDAIASDESPSDVFEKAHSQRAPGAAVLVGTFVAGFGAREAASQIAEAHNVEPTKTWVTGTNPRPEHAAMDGETVPLHDAFSNGMQYPGEGGEADEVAGCNCEIEISV